MKTFSKLFVVIVLITSVNCSGSMKSEDLASLDGCYYARNAPIIRVHGATGDFLIPGNIRNVNVSLRTGVIGQWACMTPAFAIVDGNTPTVSSIQGQTPQCLGLTPMAPEITIRARTDRRETIELVRGLDC
jgi:hypothetical protein